MSLIPSLSLLTTTALLLSTTLLMTPTLLAPLGLLVPLALLAKLVLLLVTKLTLMRSELVGSLEATVLSMTLLVTKITGSLLTLSPAREGVMMVIPLLLVPTLLSLSHLIIPVALIVDILVVVYRLVIFWLLILMSMNLFSLVMASCRIIYGYRFLNLIDRGLARYWLNIAALSESGPVVSANLPTITATKASTVPSRSSMAISSWNTTFVSTSAKSFTNIPKLVLFNTVHVAVR